MINSLFYLIKRKFFKEINVVLVGFGLFLHFEGPVDWGVDFFNSALFIYGIILIGILMTLAQLLAWKIESDERVNSSKS